MSILIIYNNELIARISAKTINHFLIGKLHGELMFEFTAEIKITDMPKLSNTYIMV
jgi:hypothetical protein